MHERLPLRSAFLAIHLLLARQETFAATLTCSSELALSGYPSCANSCYSICDKYCPSSAVDLLCTCREQDYVREIYTCISSVCTQGETDTILAVSATGCKAFGYDIRSYIEECPCESATASRGPTSTEFPVAVETSAAAGSGQGGGGSSETSSASGEGRGGGGQPGVPVSTVVGIALGIGLGLLLIGALVWWFLRRRRSAVTTSALSASVTLAAEETMKQPPVTEHAVQTGSASLVPTETVVYTRPVEVEGNAPANAPGWRPLHELG